MRKKGKMAMIGAWIEAGLLVAAATVRVQAQSQGSAGITTATTTIAGYFDLGVTLMYTVGAIIGLIGAVRVYQKWSHGDQDTGKVAANWFGACIFLVVVATILKSFFNIT